MATVKTHKGSAVFGRFEPELAYTFLPGCRSCGGAHPLARKPVAPADECPDCGAMVDPPGPTKVERAAFGFNPAILFARAMMAVGRVLGKLSQKV